MAATGVLGLRLYVGTAALADIEASADALADFTALSSGVEIGLIESLGNFGKTFDLVPFQAIKDGRKYKLKGGYDNGSLDLTCGYDPLDAGQALLLTYGSTADQNTYPFSLFLNGVDSSLAWAHFGGKVFSSQRQAGSVNNVLKVSYRVEINTEIFQGSS